MTLYAVEFAGIVFDGEPNGDGMTWCWESIDGWFGMVARGTNLVPEGFAGEVPAGHGPGSRALLFTGFCGVPDGPTWWAAVNGLEAAVEGIMGADVPFIVHEPEPKQLQVRMAPGSRLTVGRRGELRPTGTGTEVMAGFTFSIPLMAADPVKTAYAP